MNRVVPVLLLGIVVSVSGCTVPGFGDLFGGGTTGEADIIVIKNVQAIPDSITVPQSVRLVVDVENRGTNRFDRNTDDTIIVRLFDYCQGLFEEPVPDVETEHVICLDQDCTINRMLPQEVVRLSWTLKARPNLQVQTTCDLKVSASYPFTTNGLTSVHFIDSVEQERQLEQGTFRPISSQINKGEGPVKGWFEIKDEQPIPIQGRDPRNFFTQLRFQNVGSGSIVSFDGSVPTVDVDGLSFGPSISFAEGDCTDKYELIQKRRDIPCRLKMSGDVDREATFQLPVQFSYVYEVRSSEKVTVKPQII